MKFKLLFLAFVLSLGTGLMSFTSEKHAHETIVTPGGKWYKFTSEDGKISISFPAEPAKDKTEAEEAVTHKVSVTEGTTTYFFGYTYHENELADAKELAQVSLDSFTEAVGGTIKSQGVYKYKKNEGLEAKITIEDQGYIMYKVIIIGQVQYQLVVINTVDEFGPDADKFFNSFKIK